MWGWELDVDRLCVEQSRGAPAESGSARRGADGTCWKLLIKALSHLLLLCPSLCLRGGVKGVLKEDKPVPCVCVCVDPELQEFGALGTQQAGGWGCVPVLGSVPAPAPLRHGLAVTCPQQPGPEIPPGSGALGSSPGSCSEQSGEREAVPSSTTSIPSLLPDPSGCCIQELLALHPQKK